MNDFTQYTVMSTSSSSNVTLTSLSTLLSTTMSDMDTLWVLVCTMMVFLMQTGFSFLEAGSVRNTSVVNILTKVCFSLL